ncbi:MAG: hypothetical protein PHX83_06725 [Acidobacteriia bacterium]|nr:hypothetical protein [Terriglobia bacterium]
MTNHRDICGDCHDIFDGDEPCDDCQFQAAKKRILELEQVDSIPNAKIIEINKRLIATNESFIKTNAKQSDTNDSLIETNKELIDTNRSLMESLKGLESTLISEREFNGKRKLENEAAMMCAVSERDAANHKAHQGLRCCNCGAVLASDAEKLARAHANGLAVAERLAFERGARALAERCEQFEEQDCPYEVMEQLERLLASGTDILTTPVVESPERCDG